MSRSKINKCDVFEKEVKGKRSLQTHKLSHEYFQCESCNSEVRKSSKTSHIHGCPFCEGYKDQKLGVWIAGCLRTFKSLGEYYTKYTEEGNSKRSNLKFFMSCEEMPLQLMKNQDKMFTLFVLPPDPLHVILLGPVNDVMDKLEQLYPVELREEFYPKNHFKKSGEGPGGNTPYI